MKKDIKKLVIIICFIFAIQIPAVAHSDADSGLKGGAAVSIPESVSAMAVKGHCLYVGKGSSVLLFDDTEGELAPAGRQLKLPSAVSDLVVEGNTLFAAAGNSGLYIFDISSPIYPVETGVFRTQGYAETVTVSGSTVCIQDRSGALLMLDVSNRAEPVLLKQPFIAGNNAGRANTAVRTGKYVSSGNYLYVAGKDYGLSICDISDIAHPVRISAVDYPGGSLDGLALFDGRLYCFDSLGRILSFDASKSRSLKLLQCRNVGQAVLPDLPADVHKSVPVNMPAELKPSKHSNKIAYITIDDGPSRRNTPVNLDTLKRYGVKATFFVLPKEKVDDIYKRILDEGHVIGNHSYSHVYSKLYGSVDEFKKDVQKADAFIQAKLNYKPTLFRFPGGAMSRSKSIIKERAEILSGMGYTYFDWNSSTADTASHLEKYGNVQTVASLLANNVLKNTGGRKRLIVLMHDAPDKIYSARALPIILEGLAKQGYTFDTLDNYSKAQ